ncbi:MAG: cytochrome c oxidase subunit I, partial [Burkholderiales bacterium]|nr:cytochrome c oxidase subunit I [Burkholderiales bacterium]
MATAAARKQLFGYAEKNYLNCSTGFKSWAFTLDHKRIGIMYTVGVCTAMLMAGVFALVLRSEL